MSKERIVYEASPESCHWKTLFPNKMMLLGSQHLNPGEELVAHIQSVGLSKIKNQNGKEEEVPVMTFDNAPPMVLNVTNSKILASLYGEHYSGWPGKDVQIYSADIRVKGEAITALRIRPVKPPPNPELIDQYASQLREATTLEQLKGAFLRIPNYAKNELTALKDEIKERINEQD